MNNESFPIGSKIRFEFPARKFAVPAVNPSLLHKEDTVDQVATTFWWYDGANQGGCPRRSRRQQQTPGELTTDCEALLGEVPAAAACGRR